MAPLLLVTSPFRYMRWAARERPAIFWSFVIGCMGPVTIAIVPPLRERFGDPIRPLIPLTYPIPKGPRQAVPEGYDD